MNKKISILKQVKGDNVTYCDSNYNRIGEGFITSLDRIALVKCPLCHRYNHQSNVNHGLCAWCGFDANDVIEIVSLWEM
jgi:hypothetical protein